MRRRWRFSVRIHCKMAPLQPGKGHILDSGNLHLLFFSKVSMKNYSTPSATRRWKVKWQKYSYWLVVFESVFSTIHSQNVMLMIRQKNYLQKELPSKRTVRKLVAWKIRIFFCRFVVFGLFGWCIVAWKEVGRPIALLPKSLPFCLDAWKSIRLHSLQTNQDFSK